MSFILDALKKSESERQRQNGPSLYEMRVTPPRMRLPLWAVAIVVLLGVNLSVVVWMLLHRPGAAQAAVTEAPPGSQRYVQAPAGSIPPPGGAQQPMMPQAGMAQPPMTPQPAMPQPGQYPYPGAASPPQVAAATPPPMNPSPPYPASPGGPQTAAPGGAFRQADGASPAPGQEAAPVADASPGPAGGNPDDYAPAIEQAPGSIGSHVRHATESGLPLYPDTDAAPSAGLPALHLDLHVYGATPQERFVLINMHHLREGDVAPEGVRVEAITIDGAVISRGGSRYFLPGQ
jgi:general secretion pathway protein B